MLAEKLHDPNWHGSAKVAGWWLWGQCAWIGSGWCSWDGKVPHASDAGRGIQAIGKVPHVSDAGRGIQAIGKVPHVSDAGRGKLWTSSGRTAWVWLQTLADRLERVRVVHGEWQRCLNHHYGGTETAVFLDPPYRDYEQAYGTKAVADEVVAWAQDNAELKIALCGHIGDYDLLGWTTLQWTRGKFTYSGKKTTDKECIWFSPPCRKPKKQISLWSSMDKVR